MHIRKEALVKDVTLTGSSPPHILGQPKSRLIVYELPIGVSAAAGLEDGRLIVELDGATLEPCSRETSPTAALTNLSGLS